MVAAYFSLALIHPHSHDINNGQSTANSTILANTGLPFTAKAEQLHHDAHRQPRCHANIRQPHCERSRQQLRSASLLGLNPPTSWHTVLSNFICCAPQMFISSARSNEPTILLTQSESSLTPCTGLSNTMLRQHTTLLPTQLPTCDCRCTSRPHQFHWRQHRLPTQWKSATIIPIPSSGTPADDPLSGPIARLSS